MNEVINNESLENPMQEEQEGSFNLRSILELSWALRYWILLSIFIAICCASAYLYFKPKTYSSSMMVMVTNDKNAGMGGSAELSFLSDLTGAKSFNNLVNEQIIIRSTPVLQDVVKELDLNIRYYVKHNFVTKETLPIEVKLVFIPKPGFDLNDLGFYRIDYDIVDEQNINIEVSAQEAGEKKIIIPKSTFPYNTGIPLEDCGELNFTFRGNTLEQEPGKEYNYTISGKHYILFYSPLIRARQLSGSITTEIVDEKARNGSSSILRLSMTDNIASRSETVLEKTVQKYNETTKNYYSISNRNTKKFIEERLVSLSEQLTEVETKMQNFGRTNDMVDLQTQASLTLNSDKMIQDNIQQMELQLKLLSLVQKDMQDQKNEYVVIPSNIGISEMAINTAITEYNKGCMERMRLIASASPNNPVILQLSAQLDVQRNLINESINKQISLIQASKKNYESQLNQSKNYLQSIPGQQIGLAQINREQLIIEPLYVLLQKKLEETQLAIVAEPDIARVVEHAEQTAILIGPNSKRILSIAAILGLLFPIGIVYLFNFLKTKIQTPEDISSRTRVPIIGVIPFKKEAEGLKPALLHQNKQYSTLNEIFRSVRTNLGFTKGQVFQITSSIPGEGKSFSSYNLATSMAMIGKKVILIETDMRKGHMNRAFDLPRRDNKGLANYLSGDIADWRDTIHKSVLTETLDVILKGAVPPNPNELLASERMDQMIQELRKIYDYIILDSPPYLVIADPVTLNRVTDRTIYVMRAGKADLRFIGELNSAIANGKLADPVILLNGVAMTEKGTYKYSYGYGYGYGYGYSYGYKYGYEDQNISEKEHHGLRWFLTKKMWGKA